MVLEIQLLQAVRPAATIPIFERKLRQIPLDDDEHARALEEQWMEGLGAGGNELNRGCNRQRAESCANFKYAASSGMYVTLFKGVIAGFFLPFLPLFFFRAESAVFTKQMQMAIIAGCAVNVLYGALRAFA